MISSLDNKTVKDLCRLHQKKYRTEQFLLLDERSIELAHESGHLVRLIWTNRKPFDFADDIEVTPEVLEKIAKKKGLGYIGVSKLIEEGEVRGKRILMLDRLQDPLNIGRIMEAAQLFGFETLILSADCADIYNERCLELGKGGIYKLHIVHRDLEKEIPLLQEKGYAVYATGLQHDTKELHEIEPQEKMAFIMGNEGGGVDLKLMEKADETVKIAMRNIDSLNVGMAAAIIMHRFRI